MSDPYNHPFLRRDNTMYLSTIGKADFPSQQPFLRQSSFLSHDIQGTDPRVLIPKQPHQTNYSLSTYVEPVPDHSRKINKTSDPLFIDDIEGARPRVTDFRSRRMVDPLCPKYQLPSANEIVPDNGRQFIRDTLSIQDINGKKAHAWLSRGRDAVKEPIEGSSPSKLTKNLQAKSRLEVKDINKDGIFESNRRTDPLQPTYHWRQNDSRSLNPSYGHIAGTSSKQMHPTTVNRPNNLSLGVKDIEGTQANSFFARSHFIDKRREFRNYMATQDIEKSGASTLKKGITTARQTNPLMPHYQYPGNSETH